VCCGLQTDFDEIENRVEGRGLLSGFADVVCVFECQISEIV